MRKLPQVTGVEMQELADALLSSRPHRSAMWDARLYTTHAPILSRAVNADDLLSDSNYECVLSELNAVVTAWLPDGVDLRVEGDEYEFDVIDARVKDWAWGPADQLFVRVYEPCGGFADAWAYATSIVLALRDYPVYNESDWSERECAAIDESFEEASARAQSRCDTSDSDHVAILGQMGATDVWSVLWDSARDHECWVCPDDFEAAYRDAARQIGIALETL